MRLDGGTCSGARLQSGVKLSQASGVWNSRPSVRVPLALTLRRNAMFKFVVTALLLGAAPAAWAQSQPPSGNDDRPNIRAETHCKDKSGHVWLKSSAELAGRTSNPATSGAGATATPPSQGSTALPGAAGASSAAALPDCPDQRPSEAARGAPANPAASTPGSRGGASGSTSDTSGEDRSTRTPGGLTPD